MLLGHLDLEGSDMLGLRLPLQVLVLVLVGGFCRHSVDETLLSLDVKTFDLMLGSRQTSSIFLSRTGG